MKTRFTYSIGMACILMVLLLFAVPPVHAQVDVTIGTGTLQNTTMSYPAPYGNYYYGARHQFLLPASEIISAGGSAGTILALAFDVATPAYEPLIGFQIKLAATTATNLTNWHTGPITTVYSVASYTDVSGWNTHTFSFPFVWDGTSNLIVETCFNNPDYEVNAIVNQSATTYESSIWYCADASGVCTSTSITGTDFQRPNIRLTIGGALTCPPPTSIVATNVTSTSLDLNWSENGTATEWQIQGGLTGFPLGSGLFGVTPIKPVPITGLDPSTTYDFYVRSICGPGDTSLWAGPYTVTTSFQCPANAVCATYTAGDIPTDYQSPWVGPSTCPGQLSVVIPPGQWITSLDVKYDMTAANVAYMSEQRSRLFSPTINAGEANYIAGVGSSEGTYSYNRTGLTFANQATGTVYFDLDAGRTWGSTAPNDGCGTYYNKVDNGTWSVIAYYGPIPACPAPSLLSATSTAANIVELNWNEQGSATQWQIEYGPLGFTQGAGTSVVTSVKPYNLSGLTTGMIYEYYVRSICSAVDTSSWSGPKSFAPALSGTYTIGVGPLYDFQSFNEAVNFMNIAGVIGSVTFEVATDTYTEQVTLGPVPGASAINNITFTSMSGDSTDVVLQYAATSSTDNWVVLLDNAQHITFSHMTVKATGASNGRVFEYMNDASYNTITNCVIQTDVTATGSAFAGIYSTSNTPSNYVDFSNNHFIGGYYSIYWYATAATQKKNFIFENNILEQFHYYGAYVYRTDSSFIKNNRVTNRTTSGITYGIYLYYNEGYSEIYNNIVHLQGTGSQYGITSGYKLNTSTDYLTIANNFVTQEGATGTVYGIYALSTNYVNIYNNSVNIMGGSATAGRAFYQTTGSNINIVNNSFANIGGGYAYYINTPAAILNSNYNNYFNLASPLAYWGSAVNDLTALQTANSMDANSVNADPVYLTNYDLHSSSLAMWQTGTPLAEVPFDIDGEPRDPLTPCIGADEFVLMPNDAGVEAMTSPVFACAGLNDIYISVRNYGIAPLNSVVINWSVNGMVQTSTSYSTTIPVGDAATVNIGSFSFVNGVLYDLVFWTSSPNGSADQNTANDTLVIAGLQTSMSGTYTIGGPGADYTNFEDAILDLQTLGVCAHVIFNVDPANGPYTGGFEIGVIPGTSATNTITFNGNGSEINEGTPSYIISLNAVTHVTFDNFNIINTVPTVNKFGILLRGGSQYITISNNYMDVGTVSTGTANSGIVASNSLTSPTTAGNNVQYLTITNNEIVGGYYGISLYGQTNYLNNYGHVITDNIIRDFYLYGIRINDGDTITIARNDINRATRAGISSFYGIYTLRGRNMKVLDNMIHSSGVGSYTAYPIYHSGSENSIGYETEYINNIIYNIPTTSTLYGIYMLGTRDYMNIYHNTVDLDVLAGTKRAVFMSTAPNNHNFKNNILNMRGDGTGTKYLIYITTTSATFSSDNNVFNQSATGGTNHIGYWTANRTTLLDWQTNSSQDANSSDTDPVLASPLLGDLTPLNAAVDNMGTPVGVMTDIYGNPRSATTPDVGAIEFTGIAGDLALTDVKIVNGECLSANDTIFLTISNIFGSTVDLSVNPLTAHWSVVGPVNSSGTIIMNSGMLTTATDLTFWSANVDLSTPGTYTVSAFIEPNAVNLSALNDSLWDFFILDIIDPFYVVPKYIEITDLDSTIVDLTARSKFFPGGAFFITEICQYNSTAATGHPTGGYPSWLPSVDFIEITGVPNSDLGGYTLEQWSTSALTDNHTFPPGTLLSPNGTAVIRVGSGSAGSDPANFYYDGVGVSASWSSTTQSGRILKDPNGVIIDAVGYPGSAGNYTFPAAAGVTAADWSGNVPAANGTAGIRLIGPYTKDATNWVVANGSPHEHDPNTLNSGVTPPTPGGITGFTWTHNGVVTSTLPDTTVGPFTVNGIYEYIASYATPCGILTDTARINIMIPPYDAAITEILPNTEGCGLGQEVIAVMIANRGAMPISGNITASYLLDGGTVVTEAVPNAIPSGDTITFTFTTLADFSVTGVDSLFKITAWVTLLGDTVPLNDTARSEVNSLHIPDPPIVADVAIPAGTQAILHATSNYDVNWYELATDTIPLFTGLSFTTPVLNDLTTYWVEAVSGVQTPGQLTTHFNGGTSCGGGFMIDVKALSSNIAVEAFDLSFAGAGIQTVNVYYKQGTFTGFGSNQAAWTLEGSYSVNGVTGNVPTFLALGNGFAIPEGETYGIYLEYNNAYTSGSYTTFSNADIELYTGLAHCSAFDACCEPRIWNGTIYYTAGIPGCESPKVPVIISMEATATAITADQSICPGDQVLLEVALSGTAPYTLIVTDGTNIDTIPNIPGPTFAMPVAPTTTTTYSVLNVINGYGFVNTSTAAVTITVYPLLTADAGMDVEMCLGVPTQLSATGVAGSGVYTTYQWTPTTGLSDAGIHNPMANPAVTTTYTVHVTDDNGCHATDDVVVTVLPLPVVNAGPDDNVCYGSSIQLSGAASGGSGVYVTYDWTPAADLSDATIPNPVASPITTTTYSLTVTDDKGCEGTDNVVVSVRPLPIVNAGPDQSTCAGMIVYLNATATGATAPYSYEWSPTATLNNAFIHNPQATPQVNTTYTVTVTDFYGCLGSDEVTVFATALPVANAGADVGICSGHSTQLQASGGTTYQWSPTYGLSNPNISNPVANPIFTTTYTVTVSSICGVATDDVVVTVYPITPVVFIGLPTSTCVNSAPITLTGAPAGGTFSGAGITGNIFDPALAGVGGPYPITYTYVDANNCTQSATYNIMVYAAPFAPNIGFTPANVCINTTPLQLVGVPSGGVFSGPGVTGNTFDPAIAGLGTFTITYTVTNAQGCSNYHQRIITVNPLPTVSFSGLSSMHCTNEPPVPIFGNPSGGTFTGPGAGAATFSPFVAGPGTHTITYTYNDALGCSNFQSQVVTVSAPPTVSFVGLPTEYCVNAGHLTLVGNMGGTNFSGSGVTGNLFDPTIPGPGYTAITYTYTDPVTGCTNSVNATILVRPATAVGITGSTNACINGPSINLSGSPAGGVLSGAGVTGNQFNPVTAGLGNHVVTYTFTNSWGCITTATHTVTVHPQPSVAISGLATSYCIPSTQVTILGGIPTGGTFSGPGVSANLFNPQIAGTGSKIVTYTYTDQYGCTNSASATTMVNSTPASFTGLASTYCLNSPVATLVGSTVGATTGTFTGTGVVGNTFDPAVAGVGGHTITYTLTDPTTGCTGVSSQTTVVYATPNVFILNLPASQCVNGPVITVATSPATGGTLAGPGIVGNTFDPAVAGTGTHTITYSFTNANNCTVTATQTVTVHGLTSVSFTGLDPTYCDNDPWVNLIGSPAGGLFSGPGIYVVNRFHPGNAGPGVHTITYTYKDANGCTNAATQNVEVFASPSVDLGPPQVICINHQIVLDAGTGFSSYLWSTGATTQTITVDAATLGLGSRTIMVTVTNANNCSAKGSVVITVIPCTGIEEAGDEKLIKVFPNPSAGQFNLLFNNFDGSFEMSIFTDVGQLIRKEQVEIRDNIQFIKQVDLSTHPTGIYFIRLMNDDISKVVKVIIN